MPVPVTQNPTFRWLCSPIRASTAILYSLLCIIPSLSRNTRPTWSSLRWRKWELITKSGARQWVQRSSSTRRGQSSRTNWQEGDTMTNLHSRLTSLNLPPSSPSHPPSLSPSSLTLRLLFLHTFSGVLCLTFNSYIWGTLIYKSLRA